MLNNAGSDMAKANNKVLMPLAPFTKRNTRPTLATLTTRRSVGDTKYLEIKSLNTNPVEVKPMRKLLKIYYYYFTIYPPRIV